jgi:histidyl-tRNA synthetase
MLLKHMAEKQKKVSTEPYKGVRDFYPEDTAVQNYIFGVWRDVVERYGYSEYNASILEPAELYRAKSGEEIVNEQTYSFIDRGDREVTLRPEMTPTVARMVAAKRRELSFPLRWYSIPNLFRYERPQRGRLREHWQLNVDTFGLDTVEADAEIATIAYRLLQQFGLHDEQFSIRIHSRMLLNTLFDELNLSDVGRHDLSKLLDRKAKMESAEFTRHLESVVEPDKIADLQTYLQATMVEALPASIKGTPSAQRLAALFDVLAANNVRNAVFDPAIVRGFDYYTGMVFEVFDTSTENNRSLFGGGRYDDLLDIFGQEKVPAVGFGMGDVTIRDVLETYNLIPEHSKTSKTQVYICILKPEFAAHATKLAESLRKDYIRVAIDYTYKKIGDQIGKASKDGIPYVILVGENEVKKEVYTVKYLPKEQQSLVQGTLLAEFIIKKT